MRPDETMGGVTQRQSPGGAADDPALAGSPVTESMLPPTVAALRQVAAEIAADVCRTPVVPWPGRDSPVDGELFVKLELLQRTGSFKPRGAINALRNLGEAGQGATAFSAGNHAIALAYAAHRLGVSAKVVMPRSANPYRIECCRRWGAEIEFGDTIADLFGIVQRLERDEGRVFIHPFEGPHTVAGTGTVGVELCDDVPALDAVIVPVGGGGLIAGVACAVKQLQPGCRVIGVEPEGACGMFQSLSAGRPQERVVVDTIADSLGAPMHTPFTFEMVRRHVDELVQVSDTAMRNAMRQLFVDMKLAVEPACASSLAALTGPLVGRYRGQRVAMIACGSNIDIASWQKLVS